MKQRTIVPGQVILTDDSGRPIEVPQPPGPDASYEDRVAYIRARSAFVDAVTERGNRSFAEAFPKGLKRG